MKILMRYHLTPFGIVIMNKQKIRRIVNDMEKLELYTVGGNVKWCIHYRR